MNRTSPVTLIVAVVVGGALGYLLDLALTTAGRATFTPSLVLPLSLVLLGAVVVALAIPIRRSTRGVGAPSPDPFRAVRVAVLAKSSSIVGAAMGGAAAGLALFLLTRPAPPSLGSVGAVIATMVSGAALVVAALVAEQMCTLRRKDDDDDDRPGARLIAPDPPR